MICDRSTVHDPHWCSANDHDNPYLWPFDCEGRTHPTGESVVPPAPVNWRELGIDTDGPALNWDLLDVDRDRRESPGRRAYDNRTGMPKGQDGDRLYGRRASDPR